ncbi:DEAD/DEAH box helicase family protein [Pyxidicoccus parkwayensis]|uniref:DEAD/DEAH box helicase family protein n=1 Tax=Pyxidicoccus parkwayensis TaxID=2813578 RepID=A0ABX7NMI9_9BACT|nr:DEAD/DEAH box helicase family protein [Pyxidicoccus parkwaysis]QSQ19569.1 DEAD/DEAH box helicase family protein [Pyxidicoccus parkwaysis]
MLDMSKGFLDERRLLDGPWQMLERDVARLMLANAFVDVRIVAGSGDHGGDVLGVKGDQLWVFQCKHTTTQAPPKSALAEVVNAARYYGAQRMVVATSRQPGDAFREEQERYRKLGLNIETVGPRELLQLMAVTPEHPPHGRTLRTYQEVATECLRTALVERGRGQLVMATGLGKTVVMAEATASLLRDGLVDGDRVLVLAHTRDLVEQLHRSFWLQLPRWVPTHHLSDGEAPAFWEGITFATIQSAVARLDRLPRFGLVLIDEAHHLGAEIFQRTLASLEPPMLAGVTATPWRGDAYDIDQMLGEPVFRMGIAEGLAKGFLAEVDYRLLADNIDWHFVQSQSKHRYSLAQLNRRLIIPMRDEEAARQIRAMFDEQGRRAGIVFCPTIEHAHSFVAALRKYEFKSEVISAETQSRDRDALMSRFRAGELQIVATVDLFNEGVDVPDVDLVVFMRATHSRRIFVQQLGRGLRISGAKDKVIVLDFVTDLRRVAEVLELDRATRRESVERLGLGERLVCFNDRSAGSFLREWVLDQADLMNREGDAALELPEFDFPRPVAPGGIQ